MNFGQIERDGDLVVSVEVKRGYAKRPIWECLKAAPTFDFAIQTAARLDALCSVSAEWAVAQALEESLEIRPGAHVDAVRSLYAEINRLIYLMTYLGRMSEALGTAFLKEQAFILREQVFALQEEILGARVLPLTLSLGGVRRPVSVGNAKKIRQFVKGFEFQWIRFKDLFFDDPVIELRLKGLAAVKRDLIEETCWFGIVGKAHGLSYDARFHRPYGAYQKVNFELAEFSEGDAWARSQVVSHETESSLKLINQFLLLAQETESGKSESAIQSGGATPSLRDGYFTGSVESAKGCWTSALFVENSKIQAFQVFTANQRIYPWAEKLLAGLRYEDLGLAWASYAIDLEEAEMGTSQGVANA